MNGGTISSNTNNGGVYISSNGSFTKTGGTIYGNDDPKGNTVRSRQGRAVYWASSPARWRNATAWPGGRTDGYGFWLND